ncbi:MAG: MFS transporter [Bdellovibrionaceae bacterium]|nr:MFS transporter [Pseudobdellovibrionaceae bacterium]
MNWGYIVLAYLSLFALGISDNVRGPLFPEILKEFAVTDARGAQFFALSSFLGFLGSYGVRFLLLKLRRVSTLQIALLLMTIGLIGMGSAIQFSSLLFFSAIFGLSLGIIGVVQNILVTVGSSPHRRQRLLSGLHSIYGISSFLAPLLVAAINSWVGSWRFVFWSVAAVPFLLMFGAFFEKDERALPLVNVEKLFGKEPNLEHAAQTYLGFSLGLYVLAEILISSRLALFIRRELGLGLQDSSYYLTGFFVCLLLGRGLFALIHFNFSLRRMLSVSLVLSAFCIILGLVYHPFFLVLSGATMAPFYPLAISYIHHHFESHIDSAVSSAMAIQSLLTVLMHVGVGYLTDVFGISKAMWVGPVALVLSFLVLNSFERVFRKKV